MRRLWSVLQQPRVWCEFVLACALLAALLAWHDLPLVDLPQHALQIQNWIKLDHADPSVHAFELNLRTPYLLGYVAVRALAGWLDVLLALKLVLWAAVVLQVRALTWLAQRLGHSAWFGLLGFPLGLGYSFCWGFVSFCAAVPLIYLGFGAAHAQREAPSLRRGALLAGVLSLLLVAHGVAFGFTALLLGPMFLARPKRLVLGAWPFGVPVLLGLLWLAPERTRLGGDVWRFEPERFLELPGQLVGSGSGDLFATGLGLALLAVLMVNLGPLRSRMAAVPLLVAVLGYALFPTLFRGAGPLGPRFAAFIVPAALLAFSPDAEASQRSWSSVLAGLASISVLVFSLRLCLFQRESRDFHALIEEMPRGMSVRPLVFDRGGRAFPGLPSFLHFPAYYALQKGGSAGYSFAMYSISVVRLRTGERIKMWGGAEWTPWTFNWAREQADYDYFMVRSSSDRAPELFGTASAPVSLEQHAGDWWGYTKGSLDAALRY
ncbi:MAG: hypothetical protein QM756_24435 [Polyangiaceae bacterium]